MYKFIKTRDLENQYDITEVTFEVDAEVMDDLVSEFEAFLRASGFHPKGHLVFSEGEE